MGSIDSSLPPLKPSFDPNILHPISPIASSIIAHLHLRPHPEGGYFVETDRDPLRIPNPFKPSPGKSNSDHAIADDTRSASTSIFYYLTPGSPLGHFHRNKARTVHTLHKGRGRYVIIHADEVEKVPGSSWRTDGQSEEGTLWTGKARVESFVVGQDVLKGERLQWVVEGGKYKASFLLPDDDVQRESEGLLISETVVPGFEYADHDFLKEERLRVLVGEDLAGEMGWIVRKE